MLKLLLPSIQQLSGDLHGKGASLQQISFGGERHTASKQAVNKGPVQGGWRRWEPAVSPITSGDENTQESVLSDLVAISFWGHFPGEANSPVFSPASFGCHERDAGLWPGANGLERQSIHLYPLLQCVTEILTSGVNSLCFETSRLIQNIFEKRDKERRRGRVLDIWGPILWTPNIPDTLIVRVSFTGLCTGSCTPEKSRAVWGASCIWGIGSRSKWLGQGLLGSFSLFSKMKKTDIIPHGAATLMKRTEHETTSMLCSLIKVCLGCWGAEKEEGLS